MYLLEIKLFVCLQSLNNYLITHSLLNIIFVFIMYFLILYLYAPIELKLLYELSFLDYFNPIKFSNDYIEKE